MTTAGACGQELALPTAERPPIDAAAGSVDDGFTGTAGAPDSADLVEKLPVVCLPVYTHFGGAGGEGGSAEGVAVPSEVPRGSSGAGGSAPHDPEAESAGAGGAASEPLGPARLLFSEYLEGSGSHKALEIYALGASSLEGCELRTYSNGKADGAARLALHGALAAGETHVLCSSALATAQPAACDRSTNLNFNGDDALELACDDAVLDVFGQIGTDPGTAWGDGATLNHTLRRRCSVTEGLLDGKQPFDPAAEWLLLAIDTFTGLGQHTCAVGQ